MSLSQVARVFFPRLSYCRTTQCCSRFLTKPADGAADGSGLRGKGDGVLQEPEAPGEEAMTGDIAESDSAGERVNPMTGEINGPRGPEVCELRNTWR
eukprot:m.27621 g.27621  ORF g.27621 m.27621 type:complete len:97 (+) comp13448_c0_seq6:254-544(+)